MSSWWRRNAGVQPGGGSLRYPPSMYAATVATYASTESRVHLAGERGRRQQRFGVDPLRRHERQQPDPVDPRRSRADPVPVDHGRDRGFGDRDQEVVRSQVAVAERVAVEPPLGAEHQRGHLRLVTGQPPGQLWAVDERAVGECPGHREDLDVGRQRPTQRRVADRAGRARAGHRQAGPVHRLDLVRRPRLAGHPALDNLEDQHAPPVHRREPGQCGSRNPTRQRREHGRLPLQRPDDVGLLRGARLDEDPAAAGEGHGARIRTREPTADRRAGADHRVAGEPRDDVAHRSRQLRPRRAPGRVGVVDRGGRRRRHPTSVGPREGPEHPVCWA